MEEKEMFSLGRDVAIAWPIRVILLLAGILAFVAIKLMADNPLVWVVGAAIIGFVAGIMFSPLAPIWVKDKLLDADR